MKTNTDFNKLKTIFSDLTILEKRWKDSVGINDGISKYYRNITVVKVEKNVIIVDFDSYNYSQEICFRRELPSNKATIKHNLFTTRGYKLLTYLLAGPVFYLIDLIQDPSPNFNEWLYSINLNRFFTTSLIATSMLILLEYFAYELYYKEKILKIINSLNSDN